MNKEKDTRVEFEPTELLMSKAVELVEGTEGALVKETIKIGSALAGVQTREYQRMSRKYGKDHPRTKESLEQLRMNAESRFVLTDRFRRSKTGETNPKTGWIVDGTVKRADGKPVDDAIVAAYSEKGELIDEFGYTRTGKDGSFSLKVTELAEERRVLIVASVGRKPLKAKKNPIVAKPGGKDSVTIVVEDEPDIYKTKPDLKNVAQTARDYSDDDKTAS